VSFTFRPGTGILAFTPEIADASLDGSGEGQVYSTQVGRSHRVGNRILFNLRVIITDIGTLNTGQQTRVVGLPYTAKNVSNAYGAVAVGSGFSLGLTSGETTVSGIISPNTAYVGLYAWANPAGSTSFNIGELTAGGDLIISGQYEI